MKVCEKCYNDISKAMDGDSLVYHFLGEPVPEDKCDFWTHKQLNEWRAWRLKQKAEGTDEL